MEPPSPQRPDPHALRVLTESLRHGPRIGSRWVDRATGKTVRVEALALDRMGFSPVVVYREDGTDMVWTIPLTVWNGPYQVAHTDPPRRRFVPYDRRTPEPYERGVPEPYAQKDPDPDREGDR